MTYPQTQVIQRYLFIETKRFEFNASCYSSIHQIGD